MCGTHAGSAAGVKSTGGRRSAQLAHVALAVEERRRNATCSGSHGGPCVGAKPKGPHR